MDVDTVEEDIDGSIISVHVRNFFCHENLEINLNRNVNFIVGRNGSGKSAILTALVVGLGGRASATNRGSNLGSFIRKGSNSATVEIKIKNNSPKAFKHNIYGDTITIIRNINASGGSSYKVKASSGEVISTKFEEVNGIIIAHDIQVDNPISVLNQDDARSFHASDAKKKYSLFRKATNLDQTEANYVRAIDNCDKASQIWRRKHEASIQLEKEFKKWEWSYEQQLQSRDEIEAQEQRLQNEYYWSEISDLERDRATVQAQYDKQKGRLEKLVQKLSSMEQNYGSNNDIIDTLKTQIDEKSRTKSELERELHELERNVREVQSASRNVQNTCSKHNDTLKRENKKLNDLDNEIKNISSSSAASRRAELEARSAAEWRDAAAAAARCGTAQHDVTQAQAHAARLSAEHEQHRASASHTRDRLVKLKQTVRELESRGNESLAVYGDSMVTLVQRIKDATAKGVFSAPPKGPIGAYLKVKNKEWSGALEHIIGDRVNSFCVNTPEDSRKLSEIMGKVYGREPKPAVTCSKFLSKMHDVSRNKVRARGYTSALDAMDISDPVIANYLIDNLSMEQILLVPDHEEAIRLSDNVENVPQNSVLHYCSSKIVTLDCIEYHLAPNYRSYGGAGKRSKFLHVSTKEKIRQVRSEVEETEATLAQLEAQAEQSASEAKEARNAEREAARTLQALLAAKHEKHTAARNAKQMLEQLHAPHHAILVEEQEVCRQLVESLQQQLAELEETQTTHRRQIDEYEVQMRKVKSKQNQVATVLRSLNEELDQEQLKLDQGATQRQMVAQKVREYKIKMAQIEVALEEKNGVVERKTTEALALCPRVENPREKAIVCNELKKTQLKLSSIRSDGLTKEQVADKLLDVERKYRRTKQMLDRLKVLITEVQKTADKHLNFCHKVQTYIARRVQHCFQSILTLRGYSGRMDIDNARGTLEILCSGRESTGKRVASSTSSLSGGERSYSTVAFIMSLWDCVELPFYFMDEFDVFMDNVNRKIVMELLVDHALKNTNRQFVFLTPQDASSVTAGPMIKIHRMADPRR